MSPTGNTRENTSWSYFVEALKKNTADESFLPKLLSRYFWHSWQTYEFHTPVIVISIKHTQQNQTQFRPQSTLPTVDGRNSANQLRLVVHPIIYEFFTSKRWLFGISEPSTVPWTYHPMTILTTTWPWSFPPNDNSQHKSGDQDISHDWSHHPCNLRESTHGMDFVKTLKLGSIFWGAWWMTFLGMVDCQKIQDKYPLNLLLVAFGCQTQNVYGAQNGKNPNRHKFREIFVSCNFGSFVSMLPFKPVESIKTGQGPDAWCLLHLCTVS